MVFSIVKRLSTHSGRLERWFGKEHLDQVSRNMRDWYGGDIPLLRANGSVYARKGGDFVGVGGSDFASYFDHLSERVRAFHRRQALTMGAGFTGLPDFKFEAIKAGKRQLTRFNKTVNGSSTNDRWAVGWSVGGGTAPAAAPGGTAYDRTSTGALTYLNPPDATDRAYFTGAELAYRMTPTTAGSVLLYDHLFGVTKTMNSTTAEAVSGVPTRYQSTTPGDDDYAGSNFAFTNVRTVLAATAHNHNVIQYTDQDGNAASMPPFAGQSAGAVNYMDQAISLGWFMPLAVGDFGVQTLTQIQLDAAVATGVLDYYIGHPIGWMPAPAFSQGFISVTDAVKNAFQMTRVFDNACLAFLTIMKGYGSGNFDLLGHIETVAG